MMVFLSVVSFLNLPMHTARIPPVDPAPATRLRLLLVLRFRCMLGT